MAELRRTAQWDGAQHACGGLALNAVPHLGMTKLMVQRPAHASVPSLPDLPMIPNTIHEDDGLDVAWLALGEWLLLGSEAALAEKIAELNARLAEGLLVAVSLTDARQAFELRGPAARDALAALCPLDLAPSAFAPARCARTRLGEVGAFIQSRTDGYRIVVDLSDAAYGWRVLLDAMTLCHLAP